MLLLLDEGRVLVWHLVPKRLGPCWMILEMGFSLLVLRSSNMTSGLCLILMSSLSVWYEEISPAFMGFCVESAVSGLLLGGSKSYFIPIKFPNRISQYLELSQIIFRDYHSLLTAGGALPTLWAGLGFLGLATLLSFFWRLRVEILEGVKKVISLV